LLHNEKDPNHNQEDKEIYSTKFELAKPPLHKIEDHTDEYFLHFLNHYVEKNG